MSTLKKEKDADYSGPDGEALERIIRAFLDHLVAAREAQGLRQQELAKRAGLAPGHMSNIETGRRGITLPTFVRIAKGLSMRPSELATFLGAIPESSTTNGARVVAVATDGSAKRETVKDAVSELNAARAAVGKPKSGAHSPRAKVSRSQKNS